MGLPLASPVRTPTRAAARTVAVVEPGTDYAPALAARSHTPVAVATEPAPAKGDSDYQMIRLLEATGLYAPLPADVPTGTGGAR
ncbi:hypothetical protein [Streptomyces minutiscleroticus]|uniref:hypothetical protein n=1 Tax=Streptomyces minutiscleroticus TaxID=68238 RepID=UPI00331E70EA